MTLTAVNTTGLRMHAKSNDRASFGTVNITGLRMHAKSNDRASFGTVNTADSTTTF